ncbi:hypothetical protein GCM10023068_08680 [Leifsonia shinshuensis]
MQQVLEAGLEEGRFAPGEPLDLPRVDIDPDDVVPEVGHRGRVDRSEVPAAHYRKSHALTPRAPVRAPLMSGDDARTSRRRRG